MLMKIWKWITIGSLIAFILLALMIKLLLSTMTPEERKQMAIEAQKREEIARNKGRHEEWQVARIEVARNQLNKYSPYKCSILDVENSRVSPWDNHTVTLMCDNWERYEVKTVGGRVCVGKL